MIQTFLKFTLFITLSFFFIACENIETSPEKTIIKQAIQSIVNYARDGEPTPLLHVYNSAKITSVTAQNIIDINSLIDTAYTKNVDTKKEIQQLVDRYNNAISKVQAYAKDTETPPTIQDYKDIGLFSLNSFNINILNNRIIGLPPHKINSKDKLANLLHHTSNDTTPPTITLLGSNPVELDINDTYTEAGATAQDDRDGNVAVSISGVINTSVVGSYTLTYTAVDSIGNESNVTRTINVSTPPDVTNPVITLLGDNPLEVIQGNAYVEAGATAQDDRDGNITANIIITGTVDTATVATYVKTYSISDAAGNESNITRTVNVVLPPDVTAPVITLLGDNPLELLQGDVYTEAGATAQDDRDGNVAVSISGVINTSVVGLYTMTYTAADIAGNESSVIRNIFVLLPPVISQVIAGNDDAEERPDGSMYITSSDLELTQDGANEQTVGIRFTNITLPAHATILSAHIQFQVDETSSDATTLTFNGEKNKNASHFTATAYNITSRLKTDASVNWNPTPWTTEGEHEDEQKTPDLKNIVQEILNNQNWEDGNALSFIITGNGKRVAESYEGSETGAAKLVIKYLINSNEDAIPPHIVLNGDNKVYVNINEAYQELGASATDNLDGNINVIIDSSRVDTSVGGIYPVIYTATDSNNNSSYLIRLVEVLDPSNIQIIRGPYLQQGTHDSMILKWRTSAPTITNIDYGVDINNPTDTTRDENLSIEHEVKLINLSANTRYYYHIGNDHVVMEEGNETYFQTSPVVGSNTSTRIWVIGDSGNSSSVARNVYTSYQTYTQSHNTDLFLMLGDNAYSVGTDDDYQSAVFEMYPEILKQTPLWSTLGNHDAPSADDAYFKIFTFPENAEVGGIASGTEHYYSFNYANIHIVVLDSMQSDLSAVSPMHHWLESDLQDYTANASLKWLVAIWHHPPYSKGSHDSDNESRLINMRENFVPILEDYSVDIVLSGHSHAYERSKFIHGHYDLSNTFNNTHIVQVGDGNPLGDGSYIRDDVNDPGTIYTVAGASGHATGGPLDHAAMEISLNRVGSVVLDINETSLKAIYLDDNNTILDTFQIDKNY